ncbi:hypothetical protein DPMN_004980, partial [Dreissena polymorpha]
MCLLPYAVSAASGRPTQSGQALRVKEGGMDKQIQELLQCQHWTIIPRCNMVGSTKEALACARYFGTT